MGIISKNDPVFSFMSQLKIWVFMGVCNCTFLSNTLPLALCALLKVWVFMGII